MKTKETLRKHLLAERLALTPSEQQEKAQALFTLLEKIPLFIESQHVAFYWPQKGEISPLPLLELAIQMKKKCYLPVLAPNQEAHLCFALYCPEDSLTPNRFGILEPKLILSETIPPTHLDLVLLPLVAFDLNGHRIGMGSGYYDHTFAFLNQTPRPRRPYLLGLGYEFQCVDALPHTAWDVLLDGVATEQWCQI